MPRKKKEPKLYTPESAAEEITRLNPKRPITGDGIRKAIARGKLKARPVGKLTAQQWIISEEDLHDWNENRRKSPGRPPKAN